MTFKIVVCWLLFVNNIMPLWLAILFTIWFALDFIIRLAVSLNNNAVQKDFDFHRFLR